MNHKVNEKYMRFIYQLHPKHDEIFLYSIAVNFRSTLRESKVSRSVERLLFRLSSNQVYRVGHDRLDVCINLSILRFSKTGQFSHPGNSQIILGS